MDYRNSNPDERRADLESRLDYDHDAAADKADDENDEASALAYWLDRVQA